MAMHGILSWISPENRRVIADLIRQKLRPGGIVYVSYNTSPGWLALTPLQLLLKMHADLGGSEAGGMAGKVKRAMEFAGRLSDAGALYFKKNPDAVARLKEFSGKNPTYVAHEFFNEHWNAMPFAQVAEELQEAKLTYATSAILREQMPGFGLSDQAQKILAELESPILYQSVRDLFFNRRFRYDIFIKGLRSLTSTERLELLLAHPVVLMSHPDDMQPEVPGANASVRDAPFQPLIEVLAEDGFRARTILELTRHPKLSSVNPAVIIDSIRLLNGPGYVAPAQESSAESRRFCSALNKYFFETAQHHGELKFVASPVLGGGLFLSRIHQLFLLAAKQGRKEPAEQAKFAWRLLESQGKRLIRDGKNVESAEENIAELTKRARDFGNKRMPMLSALGIA
jgi:hypothetical protein